MTTTTLTGTTRPTPDGNAGPTARGTGPAGTVRIYLGLELRRMLRTRRSLIMTVVMPPALFLAFSSSFRGGSDPAGQDTSVIASILVSMALYGAVTTATSNGAGVAVERTQGWSRQLRVTPLSPWSYAAVKILASMTLGAVSVLATLLVGRFTGVELPVTTWLACGLIATFGALVFAAFGLFMGYLLPTENVIQLLTPIVAILSFAGGMFVPLGDTPFADVATVFPTYGLAELVRAPLSGGDVSLAAVLNVAVWAPVLVSGAVWRFRKDTARV